VSGDPQRFVHDARFVEAFANTEHRVLGVRLHPYCLWHQFNLEVAQSKVLLGDPLTPFDLWLAVRICTTPWTPHHRVPSLRAPSKLRFIWQTGRFRFLEEVAKFQAYLDDYVSAPKLWPNTHKQVAGVEVTPDRDFDENLELALHLVKEGTFTWAEVWTLPIGILNWCSVGFAKLNGTKIDIWTPEHEEMFQAHKIRREAGIDARGKEIAAETGLPFEQARKQAHDEYWAKVNKTYGDAAKQPDGR
jgi:hypothetical protein